MTRTGAIFLASGALVCMAGLVACGRGGAPDNGTDQINPDNPEAAAAPAPGDVATLGGTRLGQYTGNVEAGRLAYQRCTPCHVSEFGRVPIGPILDGIVGSPSATTTTYDYSDALRASGIIWTPEKLNQFLEMPRRVVPGTRMTFFGVRDPQMRADIIAYMATQ